MYLILKTLEEEGIQSQTKLGFRVYGVGRMFDRIINQLLTCGAIQFVTYKSGYSYTQHMKKVEEKKIPIHIVKELRITDKGKKMFDLLNRMNNLYHPDSWFRYNYRPNFYEEDLKNINVRVAKEKFKLQY
jgi:hypothetical protein